MTLTENRPAGTTPRARVELKAEDSTLSDHALIRRDGVTAPPARNVVRLVRKRGSAAFRSTGTVDTRRVALA